MLWFESGSSVSTPKVYVGILVLSVATVRGSGPFEGQGLVGSNKVSSGRMNAVYPSQSHNIGEF